jgi:hypothetical protein
MKAASQGVLGCPDWPNHNVMTKGGLRYGYSQSITTSDYAKTAQASCSGGDAGDAAGKECSEASDTSRRPQGIAVHCEITLLAKAEFERDHAKLIADAKHDIETWPGFAAWRLPSANIESDAQTKIEPISTTSPVQMSGAK